MSSEEHITWISPSCAPIYFERGPVLSPCSASLLLLWLDSSCCTRQAPLTRSVEEKTTESRRCMVKAAPTHVPPYPSILTMTSAIPCPAFGTAVTWFYPLYPVIPPQALGQRDGRRKPPLPGHSSTPTSSASPLKQTLAKIALAAILTPAVFIGGMALPPVGVAGAGVGAVAPAYAELEPLPLKSYSEEFSSGLAPVTSVRGDNEKCVPFSIQTVHNLCTHQGCT